MSEALQTSERLGSWVWALLLLNVVYLVRLRHPGLAPRTVPSLGLGRVREKAGGPGGRKPGAFQAACLL